MRILVVQLKRIGDLVLTTPVIECLREKFPDSSIDFAIEGGSAGLLPCLDHDEAFIFRRGKVEPGTWLALFRHRFDWVIDLTGNDRSAAVTAVARAKHSVTYAKWRNRFARKWIFTDFVESKVSHLHTADHHTALLRPLGIQKTGVPSRLMIPPEEEDAIATALEKHGVCGSFAVVHPGTVKAEKFWLPERWAAVIERLRATGMTVILTGSPSREEAAHLQKIQDSLKARDPQVVSFAGKLTLPQLAALIRRSSLTCGVDSAPLHFADALETPVLGLFGPTCPHQWRPRTEGSIVVTPLGTGMVGPEYYPGLPMAQLSTDMVLVALGEKLAGSFCN